MTHKYGLLLIDPVFDVRSGNAQYWPLFTDSNVLNSVINNKAVVSTLAFQARVPMSGGPPRPYYLEERYPARNKIRTTEVRSVLS